MNRGSDEQSDQAHRRTAASMRPRFMNRGSKFESAEARRVWVELQ